MRRGRENRFSIPIPDRVDGARDFVAAAKDVSELYQLDVKITEHSDRISVDYYFNEGGGMRDFKEVMRLADDISFFANLQGYNIILSLDYYTRAVFAGGRQLHP